MKIYTKTGDKGMTSLNGGRRVQKDSLRVAAYGDIDELNAFIGLASSHNKDKKVKKILHDIHTDLHIIGAHISTVTLPARKKLPVFSASRVKELEKIIDDISDSLPPLTKFIIPGGELSAATLHVARTVCRRAERTCVSLQKKGALHPKEAVIYLNRLSDLLFVLARYANGGKDITL